MGVRTVEAGEPARSRLLEADVEHEPAVPVGEEVVDRVGPLAARARRANLGVEGEEGRLQVAARGVSPDGSAEISADRRLRADLAVGDVRRALAQGRGQLDEVLDGRHRADRRARAVSSDSRQTRVRRA